MLARECGNGAAETILPCAHVLEGPANALSSKEIDALLPAHAIAELQTLYRHCSSARLFVVEQDPGIHLAPPAQWPLLFHHAHGWWSPAAEELEDEELDVLQSGVVFGEIPGSATYFLLAAGDAFPAVYLFTGPGLELARIADGIADLLQKIPHEGVRWMQPDVRYSYGPDVIQFHPVEYRLKRE
jgi:hypothetical protein